MTVHSDDTGNHHFYLARNDIARLSFTDADCRISINEGMIYSILRQNLRQLVIEGAEQLKFTASHHTEPLRQCLESLGIEKGVCVDIGAYDGVNYSNTFPLMEAGWSGLQVECDRNRFASLAHTYRAFENVGLARIKVTPENVGPLLQAHGIPAHFDFLSLDIDSYDYYVLEALLATHRPTLILAEVNEAIPPPVRFAVKYSPDFELDLSSRFYGQSLAMLHDLCRRHNYAILDMFYMDVFLIDAAYVAGEQPSLEQIYQRGVLSRPLPPHYASYPFDVQAAWQAVPEQALAMVRQGYARFAEQFVCEI